MIPHALFRIHSCPTQFAFNPGLGGMLAPVVLRQILYRNAANFALLSLVLVKYFDMSCH
jgi:hypothetical protein